MCSDTGPTVHHRIWCRDDVRREDRDARDPGRNPYAGVVI